MINLYHLRYFCDACRNRNMSAAARAHRVSHSAISQAVRGLESSLGQALLVHGKKQFRLTPAGEALHARAEEIFRAVDSLNSLKGADRPLAGPVKIGVSMSIGAGPLGGALADFFARYPSIDPDITLGNSSALERLLAGREIELGFGVEDGSFASFERRLLRKGKFILAKGPGKLSASPRFLLGDKGAEVRDLLGQLKRRPGARIGRVQSWALAAQLASLNLGMALVPDFLLEAYPKLKPVAEPRVKLPGYELYAFYRDYDHLSAGARAFLDFVGKA